MVFGIALAHHPAIDEPRGRSPRPTTTGRGGAGNMTRSPSAGRPAPDPEELAAYQMTADNPPATVSAGRGGAGNVRSPSRDPAERARIATQEQRDQELQEEYRRREAAAPHFAPTGRGGRGNIHHEGSVERSLSRTRSGSSQERGRREGPVGSLWRSLSRSRSRDPATRRDRRDSASSDSPARAPPPASPTAAAASGDHARAIPPSTELADVDEGPEVNENNEHLP